MTMPWLRLATVTPHDPKIRLVAETAGVEPGVALSVWVSMLCHAGERDGEDRGTLAGWQDRVAACALGWGADVVRRVREAMDGLLLAGDRILAWDRRQNARRLAPAEGERPAPKTGAERSREWRERQRNRNGDETSVTQRDSVTLVTQRHVTGVTAIRGEERREEENESLLEGGASPGEVGGCGGRDVTAAQAPPPSPPANDTAADEGAAEVVARMRAKAVKAAQRVGRGTRLPDDWRASDELLAFAAERGLNPAETEAAFRDHWRSVAGAKALKVDWDAAFRTWCRREPGTKPGQRALPLAPAIPHPTASERTEARRQRGLEALLSIARGER